MGFLDWLRGEDHPNHASAAAPEREVENATPAAKEPARSRGSFAVVDVETTGLKPHYDRVIELAIIELSPDGEIIDEWVSRFNPEGPVGATHIHGIRQEDVDNEPLFHERAAEIVARLAGRVIVAHNAAFDRSMVNAELHAAGWDIPNVDWFCTYRHSHAVFPSLEKRTLSACCAVAGVRIEDAHSALGDARATSQLLARYLTNSSINRAIDRQLATSAELDWPSAPSRRPISADERPKRRASETPFRKMPKKVEVPLLQRLAEFTPADVAEVVEMPPAEAYADLLFDCLEDGEVSDEEYDALDEMRQELGMTVDDVDMVHLAVLHAASLLVLDDGKLSPSERVEVDALADVLLSAPGALTASLAAAKRQRDQRLASTLAPLPADWALGDPLRVGASVVLTGACGGMRDELEKRASDAGVRVMSAISGKTGMLVTDGSFTGGKAKKAEQLGTRIVSPADFNTLLEHVQPAL